MKGLEGGGEIRDSVVIYRGVGKDGIENGIIWEPGMLLGENVGFRSCCHSQPARECKQTLLALNVPGF